MLSNSRKFRLCYTHPDLNLITSNQVISNLGVNSAKYWLDFIPRQVSEKKKPLPPSPQPELQTPTYNQVHRSSQSQKVSFIVSQSNQRHGEDETAMNGRFSFSLISFGANKTSKFPVGRECLKGIDTYLEEPSRESFHCHVILGRSLLQTFRNLEQVSRWGLEDRAGVRES
jgi:hypothetical protein